MSKLKVYYFIDEETGHTYRKEHYCVAQPGKACFFSHLDKESPEL